jgi:hypothetical protein
MIDSNKKKIRGWKRRIKHIDVWFEKNKNPNINHSKNRGEDYIKIRIDPWNRLYERIIPDWYFRLIISKIILIHDSWRRQYESLDIYFDLQIWLNNPNNIRSEIVCAKVDTPGGKRNYYRKSADIKNFPCAKWADDAYDLGKFDWELFDDEYLRFKEAEGLSDDEVAELLNSGFKAERTKILNQDDTMYSKKVGDVWVGRLRTQAGIII